MGLGEWALGRVLGLAWLAQLGAAFLGVDVSVVPRAALPRASLNVTYALLEGRTEFDLQSLRLVPSDVVWTEAAAAFQDRALLPLPKGPRAAKAQRFLGLKVHGLSAEAQSLFVLGLGRLAEEALVGRKARLSLHTPHLALRLTAKHQRPLIKAGLGGCSCDGRECECCERLDVPRLRLNDTGCVRLTYLPKPDYGLDLAFLIDGVVLWRSRTSLRNPPPLCFALPHLRQFASACLQLYDIRETGGGLHGCVKFVGKLYHVTVAHVDLGCFSVPLAEL